MDEQHNSSRKKLDTAIVRLTAIEDSNGFQEDSSKKWKILVIAVLTRSWILGKDSGDSGSQKSARIPESSRNLRCVPHWWALANLARRGRVYV